MGDNTQAASHHARAGAEALRRGQAREAHEHFSKAIASGPVETIVWLSLAQACHSLKDASGRAAAIDKALSLEPRNVRGLIMKADQLAEAGDARAASSFYLGAVRLAPPAGQVPSDLAPELRRARQMCERYAAEYTSYLHERLASAGFDESRSSPRFAQALDILSGKRRIYVQQPRYFYFPGLAQVQFHDRAGFPWLDAVEHATDDIRAELLDVLKDDGAFTPYVQGDPNRPHKDQDGMLNNPDWSAFYLWKNGEIVPENAARCPKTLETLEAAPLARIPNRCPSVLFSLLRPGAHIPPHNGLINTRLICHLPLIVPGRCHFRVGSETREWVEGRALLFDDSIEHEAWNGSDKTRVILLFDVWRPELTEEERGLLAALFEAIDAYSGRKPDWEI